MGITFNGQVTINGNVEIFDNGSMKIIGNQLNIDVNELPKFIEDNLRYSDSKDEYLEAAVVLRTSDDKNKLKNALVKLINMAKDLGKTLLLSGLSDIAIEVLKTIVSSNFGQ